MIEHRMRVGVAAMALAIAAVSSQAAAQEPTRASASNLANQMLELGQENGATAQRVGTWTVTETVWDAPGAAPKATKGLIAERQMVGYVMQETLRDPANPGVVLRTDYLSFNRVEGRWEYVSMDTRAAVGIMTAQSAGRGSGRRVEVIFQPFALPGSGPGVSGQMLRMRQEFITTAADHDTKDQYFTLADGTGREWLAHRYDYTRRSGVDR